MTESVSFLDRIGAGKKPPPPVMPAVPPVDEPTPYGRAVLDNHVQMVKAAPEGLRERTMNDAALVCGSYIAGGEIPYQLAHDELWTAATRAGLPDYEIGEKLPRHLDFGMQSPRSAPNDTRPTGVPPPVNPLRAELLTRNDIDNLPEPTPLIEGTLMKGTTAVVYGHQGTFKSFIALDWAACLATGKSWQGRAVSRTRTLYVVGEGVNGFRKRLAAWEMGWNRKVDNDGIIFLPRPINLARTDEVEQICEVVAGDGFGLVVFDTLARCSAGTDENSARDMGIIVDSLSRVSQASPLTTVLCLHHTGKDQKTMRGSSSLIDGVDASYRSLKGSVNTITLSRDKFKDGDLEDVINLKLEKMGDSCVINCDSGWESRGNATRQLKDLVSETFPGTGMSSSELRAVAEEAGMSKSAFYRARSDLLKEGFIVSKTKGNQERFTVAS